MFAAHLDSEHGPRGMKRRRERADELRLRQHRLSEQQVRDADRCDEDDDTPAALKAAAYYHSVDEPTDGPTDDD